MKSIESAPDALLLGAYIINAVRAGHDLKAREAVGQLLKLQPRFRASQAQEAFPIRLPELQVRIAAALRDAGIPN